MAVVPLSRKTIQEQNVCRAWISRRPSGFERGRQSRLHVSSRTAKKKATAAPKKAAKKEVVKAPKVKAPKKSGPRQADREKASGEAEGHSRRAIGGSCCSGAHAGDGYAHGKRTPITLANLPAISFIENSGSVSCGIDFPHRINTARYRIGQWP